MEITKQTRVSEILKEYGDIAEIMEMFGVKRVGGYSLRKIIAKAITVQTAAKVHHPSAHLTHVRRWNRSLKRR